MKRHLSAVLAVALLLCLWGCGQTSGSLQTDATQDTSPDGTAVTPPQVSQQPMTAVALPVVTEEHTADDGTVLLRSVYQNIELTVADPEVADTVIIDFLNCIDHIIADNTDLLTQAKGIYSPDTDFVPYLSQISFVPKRIDQSILSLSGEYVVYKGSSHPEVNTLSRNYDLTTGKPLSLLDILTDKADPQTLLTLLLDALEQQKDILCEGYSDTVKLNLSDSINWYFSENGLVFFFSPYEIGPYASGVITAEIAYDKLTGILEDAYFPAEKDTSGGSLNVMTFDVEKMSQFTQSVDVVCKELGAKAVLYTDGLLEDIRISISDGTISYTVFAAATLSPGDSIIVQAATEDTLQVQYTQNGENVTKTLSLANGEPKLIP